MSKFYTLSIGLFAFVFLTNFTGQDNAARQRVEIVFSKHTSFSELVRIRDHCEKKGILLGYKKVEYNEQGELMSLSFRVDCSDGFEGFGSSEKLDDEKKFGFFRDYGDNAVSPFGAGYFE